MNENLLAPVCRKKVKEAVFQLGGNKAPGPDGFSGKFYQASWSVVQEEVWRMVVDFF